MPPNSAAERGPALGLALACALGALVLFLIGLGQPAKLNFDETHYVPAARALLSLEALLNREHPPVGKLMIALGMMLGGDTPLGWRIMSALAGACVVLSAVIVAGRLFRARAAALMVAVLLLTNHMLYIQSRIAMLDIFMLAFLMAGACLLLEAALARRPPLIRLLLASLFFALAIGAKWNAAPVVALLCAVAVVLASRRSRWFGGIGPWWLILILGPVSAFLYLATFLPGLLVADQPLRLADIVTLQGEMWQRHSALMRSHPYSSQWWQWMLNLRPVWYFYEPVAGIQRGVLQVGNPLIMFIGLPALLVCLATGWRERRWAMLGIVAVYAVSLGVWIVAPKPLTFFYHYLIPITTLCFAIAAVADRFWLSRGRILAPALLSLACISLFAWFYPILSAIPLDGRMAYEHWMWLDSWR